MRPRDQLSIMRGLERRHTHRIAAWIGRQYRAYRTSVAPPLDDTLAEGRNILHNLILDAWTRVDKRTTKQTPVIVETDIDAWAEEYAAQRVVAITDTTREILLAEYARAVAAGEGWQGFQRRVSRHVQETYKNRARTIARTETHTAVNTALFNRERQSGARSKIWRAVLDSRTRHNHAAANGLVVDINDNFTVGGYPLAYPGDPNGPPGEIINCRCIVQYLEEPVAGPSTPSDRQYPEGDIAGSFEPVELSGLSESDINILRWYTAEGYRQIDEFLRYGKRATINGSAFGGRGQHRIADVYNRMADQYDKLARPSPGGAVYRGVSRDVLPSDLGPGTVITDFGFVSTSERASAVAMVTDVDIIVKILLPAGELVVQTRDYLPGGLSVAESPNEYEILIRHGAVFEVVSFDGRELVVKLLSTGALNEGLETVRSTKSFKRNKFLWYLGEIIVVEPV